MKPVLIKTTSFKHQSDSEDEGRYTLCDLKPILAILYSCYLIGLQYIFVKDTDEGHHLVFSLPDSWLPLLPPQPLGKSSPL